jgi:hypothetical protein
MDLKIYFGFCPLFVGGAWRAYSDILIPMSRIESNPPSEEYKVYAVPEEHYDKILKGLEDLGYELDKKRKRLEDLGYELDKKRKRLEDLGYKLDKKRPEDRKNIEFPDISTLISDTPLP